MESSPSLLPGNYLPLLDELNRIVVASGDRMEGGLFYYHREERPRRESVYDYFLGKRINFAAACEASSRMLEIGFNAGHSALLALSRGVEYHGVDICQYKFCRPAAEFLKQEFGDQFHFYPGDSLFVLPQLRVEQRHLTFDLLHIDGHHALAYCRTDTYNAITMAAPGAWVLIDDTDMEEIRVFYEEQLALGLLKKEIPPGWVDNPHHGIGKLVWPLPK